MNHDIWKSKSFVTTILGNLLGGLLLILNAYSKVEIDTNAVLTIMLALWPILVGGWKIEDNIIAAKTGERALKYTPK